MYAYAFYFVIAVVIQIQSFVYITSSVYLYYGCAVVARLARSVYFQVAVSYGWQFIV